MNLSLPQYAEHRGTSVTSRDDATRVRSAERLQAAEPRPPLHNHLSQDVENYETTLIQACSLGIQRAQFAFKDSMIH